MKEGGQGSPARAYCIRPTRLPSDICHCCSLDPCWRAPRGPCSSPAWTDMKLEQIGLALQACRAASPWSPLDSPPIPDSLKLGGCRCGLRLAGRAWLVPLEPSQSLPRPGSIPRKEQSHDMDVDGWQWHSLFPRVRVHGPGRLFSQPPWSSPASPFLQFLFSNSVCLSLHPSVLLQPDSLTCWCKAR